MAIIKYIGNAGPGSVKAKSSTQTGNKPKNSIQNVPEGYYEVAGKLYPIKTEVSKPTKEEVKQIIIQSTGKQNVLEKAVTPKETSKQSIDLNLAVQNALKNQDIQGVTKKVMTDQEFAKAKLLNAVESSRLQQSIPPPSQYQETIIANTPKGQNLINELNKQERIKDLKKNLPEPYQDVNPYINQPMGSGGTASAYVNLGPTRQKGESLKSWYKRNVSDIEQTKSSINVALLAGGGYGALAGKVSGSTATAVMLNSKNFQRLADPAVSNKTKLASVKDIAVTLGISALGGAAFGVGSKLSENAAEALGYKVLARILRNGGTTGSIISRNIAGLSLIGAGKTTKFGIQTYFKAGMIKSGIDVGRSLKEKDYKESSLKFAELTGGLVGYPLGEKLGTKAFDLSLLISGNKIFTRPELYKKEVAVKRMPTSIQAKILTSGKDVYAYRRGPIETNLIYKPRLDKYLGNYIKNPTESIFFRYSETKGVKGNEIRPDLSVPAFVQPPKYKEMFLSNLERTKGNKINRLIQAIKETPILTDVLTVGRLKTPKMDKTLREKVIKEFATTGKLSKETQNKLLKTNNIISDKTREVKFIEEQELAIKKVTKLSNTELGFTRDQSGRLVPVIYEKGTLKPRIDYLRKNKLINEQDAKFIQRQYDMWKNYKDKYIQPKEHSIGHAKRVMENVERIINAYPEFHAELKRKYGSLDNAIKEIQRGALYHDIGKTSETSREFGTPHGKKLYNAWMSKLLPKEIQKIKKPVIKAVKTHETIAGTSKGRFTLRYQVMDLFGRYSIEQKILATADRLDLARYGMNIKSYRLPLGDAIDRLKIKNINIEKSKIKLNKKDIIYKERRFNSILTNNYTKPKQQNLKQTYYKKQRNNINLYLTSSYKPEKGYKKSYTKPNYGKSRRYIEPRNYSRQEYKNINYIINKTNYKQQIYNKNGYNKQKARKNVYADKKEPINPLLFKINSNRSNNKPVSKKQRLIKKRLRSTTLPTVFEQLVGRKGKRAKTSIKGFEALRFG